MPRVDPLYYALTRPVAPAGQAMRGASRGISALAPAVMPILDEALQNPETQQILSGWSEQAGDKLSGALGFSDQGSDLGKLFKNMTPAMSKIVPRAGAAGLAEILAGGGNMLGAPEEMWDPAIRRQNIMMSMALPQQRGAGAQSQGDSGFLPFDSGRPMPPASSMFDEPKPMLPGGVPGEGTEDIGNGMGLDWDASTAGAKSASLQEPGSDDNTGKKLGKLVGGASGAPGVGDALGAAFGAAEDLAKAPGSIFNKTTGSFTGSLGDFASQLRGPLSSAPQKSGDFGARMGQFGPAGSDIREQMDMISETQPTAAEAGLLPRTPAPMGAAPRLGDIRGGGDDEFAIDNDMTSDKGLYAPGSFLSEGLGQGNIQRGNTFTPDARKDEDDAPKPKAPASRPAAPSPYRSSMPGAQRAPSMPAAKKPSLASDLLGSQRPSTPPPLPPPSEESDNTTLDKLMQPQMGIRYRRR